MKRILIRFSSLLICLFFARLSPFPAFAETAVPEFAWEETPTGITLTGYSGITPDDETGFTLSIPSELGGKPITRIGSRAFADSGFEKVTVPASVQQIDAGAFTGSRMKYLRLETGLLEISESAFAGCTNLESIVIPGSVTSIGDSAFSGCTSLLYATLPISITHLGINPFADCPRLTAIAVPRDHPEVFFHSSALYTLSDARLVCYLSASSAEEFEVLAGTRIIGEQAFLNCVTLQNIILPESIVTIAESAFNGCTGLQTDVFPSSQIGGEP